jgi:hypothetical protein
MKIRSLICLLLLGCSSSAGLRGCSAEDSIPFRTTSTNIVDDSVHSVITSAGVDFLYENREAIIGMLLDVDEAGWANIDVPPFERPSDRLAISARDLSLGIQLRDAQLELEIFPEPLRIRIQIRQARLRINDGIISIMGLLNGACRLANGIDANTSNASFAAINLTAIVTPSIDSTGHIVAQIRIDEINLREIDIDLAYDASLPECQNIECATLCGAGDLGAALTETLYEAFGEQITELLLPLVESLANERLAEFAEEPIKFEGTVKTSSLSEFIPLPQDAHDLQMLVRPAANGLTYVSGGARNPGVGLSMDVGADAVSHPCVPNLVGEPLFSVGPRPSLSGLDPNGNTFHVGMSLADASINRIFWSVWRAGFLCLTLDSETLKSTLDRAIDSTTLSIFLPSLSALADTPKPIMVVIDPQFSKASFPLVRFKNVSADNGIPQAGLAIQLPNLGIDMYAYLNERWTRLTSVTTDVSVDMVVQATPDNRLLLVGDTPSIDNLQVTYNELLETDDVPALLRAMIDLALGSFLQDGLNFDIGLTGLISQLTGLPYDLRVAALSVGGDANDHLGMYLKIESSPPMNALQQSVDTHAKLVAVSRHRIQILVSAPGAIKPVYQYKFETGPWRPLQTVVANTLVIDEPRLGLNIAQKIEIRAVETGRISSMDMTPAIVDVTAAKERDHRRWIRLVPAIDQGCTTSPGTRPFPWIFVSIVLLVGVLRRSRVQRVQPVILVLLTMGSLGCNDQQSAPDIPCQQSAECPQGLACIQNACRPQTQCEDDSHCCALEVCQAGVCRPAPTDDCAGAGCGRNSLCMNNYCIAKPCTNPADCDQAQCLNGHCVEGSPCEGNCDLDEACFPHRNLCRRLSGSCATDCQSGMTRVVVNSGEFDGPSCSLDSAHCQCIDNLGEDLGSITRDANMAMLNGQPIFATYDSFFGDLVLVTDLLTNKPKHTYLDGFPTSSRGLSPSPSRHGLTDPGPVRGLYPQIAVDSEDRIHIAYYDSDARSLRYLRREANGQWIQPITVDQGGDVGRYAQLLTDGFGRPHIVYSVLSAPSGRDEIRYALGTNAAQTPQHFQIVTISSDLAESAPPPVGVLPKSHGVRPCIAFDGDDLVVAFMNGKEGWLYLGKGNIQGFAIHRLSGRFVDDNHLDPGGRYDDFETHRIGEHCAILSRSGLIELAFTDERTWALLSYRGPIEGGGIIQIIDAGQTGSRTRIGGSAAADRDHMDRMVVVYQDSTNNDLLLNIFTATGWLTSPLLVDSTGAVGYANSLVMENSKATIGSVRFKTAAGGREKSEVQVYSVDVGTY